MLLAQGKEKQEKLDESDNRNLVTVRFEHQTVSLESHGQPHHRRHVAWVPRLSAKDTQHPKRCLFAINYKSGNRSGDWVYTLAGIIRSQVASGLCCEAILSL